MNPALACLVLASAILLTANAIPYPNPYAKPMANPMANPLAYPYAIPQPSCCGIGQACGLGLCDCCGGGCCENGACHPIIEYADGFYGAPRIQGGYGNTYGYGR